MDSVGLAKRVGAEGIVKAMVRYGGLPERWAARVSKALTRLDIDVLASIAQAVESLHGEVKDAHTS